MKIILAENRGYCPGVRRAVQLALEALETHETVYSLGHLIHNRQVVDDLIKRGLKVVEDTSEVPAGSVLLIRSHGVSPAVFEHARQRKLTLVDATCGLVRRAQKLVEELSHQSYQVVVIGDPDHPEVRALTGYGQRVVVISGADDVGKLARSARLGVVAQTTVSPRHVADILSLLVMHGFDEIKLVNTLCDQSIARQRSATELARRVDVMFVLGGSHSANTRHLAELARDAGVSTYHLEDFSQFRPEMVNDARTVGVTAGASTPDNLIEQFVRNLEQLARDTKAT